jgi:vanillate O-demethylase ferredoxin subunit
VSASPTSAAGENVVARITDRCLEADGVVSLELESVGDPFPAFDAGAHIDVHLPNGLLRPYSLCGDPQDRRRWRIAVLREASGRGGSAAVHALMPGMTLKLGAPRNNFVLHRAHRILLFAGGIGVTPLISMAHVLHREGTDFQFHYCTRSARYTAFGLQLLQGPFAERVHVHHDDGAADQKLDVNAVLCGRSAGTRVYVCGPAGFIEHVVNAAVAAGLPQERIHFERFSSAQPARSTPARSFRIRIASTGEEFEVSPRQTIVDALRARNVDVFTSCEQGVCGSCFTPVLDGECEHRDAYLTEAARARHDGILPCVSRARSDLLVLDL